MKQILLIASISLVVSFLVILMLSSRGIDHDFMTGFGLANLILSVLGGLVSIFFFISGKRVTGRNILAASGILLLIGAGICTIFPLQFKMM